MSELFGTITAARIRRHIEALTAHGPRHRDDEKAVTAALTYIEDCLAGYGYQVEAERYGPDRSEVNLLALRAGSGPGPVLEVGAHWDSVTGSPGADDNASGVAGLLEIARLLARLGVPARGVRLCFFGGEEDGCLGSRAHVARLDEAGASVEGAIVLEMIGYRDLTPGSQRLPAGPPGERREFFSVDCGDFLALIGDESAVDYLDALKTAAKGPGSGIAVRTAMVAADHTANGSRSDHAPYWRSGRKGVMLTDTADFRNPHYHQATDTLETLDLDFAAQVTRAVAGAVVDLAGVGRDR